MLQNVDNEISQNHALVCYLLVDFNNINIDFNTYIKTQATNQWRIQYMDLIF